MKKTLFTIAATTASLGAVVYGLMYFGVFYVLSASQAQELVEQLVWQHNMLQNLWQALQMCKGT